MWRLGDREGLRSIGNRRRCLRALWRIRLWIWLGVVVLWRSDRRGQTLLWCGRWRGGEDWHAYRLGISRLGWRGVARLFVRWRFGGWWRLEGVTHTLPSLRVSLAWSVWLEAAMCCFCRFSC